MNVDFVQIDDDDEVGEISDKPRRLPKRERVKPSRKPQPAATRVEKPVASLQTMNFDRDKAVLVDDLLSNRNDRSRAGQVDVDVLELVSAINSRADYYTTSSCSGRLILVQQRRVALSATAQSAEGDDTDVGDDSRVAARADTSKVASVNESKYNVDWLCVVHDISGDRQAITDRLWAALTSERARRDAALEVWFKMEAPIVAVCARTLNDALAIHNVCRIAGVKRAAITSVHDKIVLSIADTHKVETLVARAGGCLVSREYFVTMVRQVMCCNSQPFCLHRSTHRLINCSLVVSG
jgi:tRNA wybutosine-synthesizing protein 3